MTYYGFTSATYDDQPAWFHTPEAAERFARICWGASWKIETTNDAAAGDVMDTPEKPWEK